MPLLVKADLYTHLYQEIIEEIVRSNSSVDIINKCIASGEGEVRSYLNRFELATMFNVAFGNEFFRSLVKDVVCWHLIKLANPNVNLELFRTAYEDAIKFLDKVMKGMVEPDWPIRIDDPATPFDESSNIGWSSNTKRKNHF